MMKNYYEMSDFEINMEVEKLQGIYCEDMNGRYVPTCDYCNDISVAWPIIVDNKISLIFEHVHSEKWFAGVSSQEDQEYYEPWFDSKNPLRTAMIVYLMIEDSEQ